MNIINSISLSRIVYVEEGTCKQYFTTIKADLAGGEEGEGRLIELYKKARALMAANEGNGEELRLMARLVDKHTINNNLDIACVATCNCPIGKKQHSPETKGAGKVSAEWCLKPSMSVLAGVFEEAVRADRIRKD